MKLFEIEFFMRNGQSIRTVGQYINMEKCRYEFIDTINKNKFLVIHDNDSEIESILKCDNISMFNVKEIKDEV